MAPLPFVLGASSYLCSPTWETPFRRHGLPLPCLAK
jgi:hypothetical protein